MGSSFQAFILALTLRTRPEMQGGRDMHMLHVHDDYNSGRASAVHISISETEWAG